MLRNYSKIYRKYCVTCRGSNSYVIWIYRQKIYFKVDKSLLSFPALYLAQMYNVFCELNGNPYSVYDLSIEQLEKTIDSLK